MNDGKQFNGFIILVVTYKYPFGTPFKQFLFITWPLFDFLGIWGVLGLGEYFFLMMQQISNKNINWFSSYEALKWIHFENNERVPKMEHPF